MAKNRLFAGDMGLDNTRGKTMPDEESDVVLWESSGDSCLQRLNKVLSADCFRVGRKQKSPMRLHEAFIDLFSFYFFLFVPDCAF